MAHFTQTLYFYIELHFVYLRAGMKDLVENRCDILFQNLTYRFIYNCAEVLVSLLRLILSHKSGYIRLAQSGHMVWLKSR